MGLIFGKISVETPKYEMIKSTADYEIRHYEPSVVAQVTYDPSQFNANRDAGFTLLAKYIGAIGNPQNTKAEKIAMTAPVVTSGEGNVVKMQFLLPSKYKNAEEAPKAADESVVIREEGARKLGVVRFNGVATEEVVAQKVEKLKESLEKDGFKVIGDFVLARYNPPWTIPALRTNEVMIPVE